MTVLAEAGPDDWQEAERFWIAELRRQGCNLTNFADGGQTSPVEGRGHTEASKEKMRQSALRLGIRPPSRKGAKVTEATRERLRIAKRGCKPPNMGGWNKGHKATHCSNGHEYTPENTKVMVRPGRLPYQSCRECERERLRRFQQKRKG